MKPKSFVGMRCAVAGALEIIGDRWSLLLIRDLSMGLARYDDLRANTGIPTTTLATRLKKMEKHGLVDRLRYQDRPPRFEYKLTDKGRDLWKVLVALREWGDRWDATGFGERTVETVDRETGHELTLALVDPQTGRAVAPGQVQFRPGPGADDVVTHALGHTAQLSD